MLLIAGVVFAPLTLSREKGTANDSCSFANDDCQFVANGTAFHYPTERFDRSNHHFGSESSWPSYSDRLDPGNHLSGADKTRTPQEDIDLIIELISSSDECKRHSNRSTETKTRRRVDEISSFLRLLERSERRGTGHYEGDYNEDCVVTSSLRIPLNILSGGIPPEQDPEPSVNRIKVDSSSTNQNAALCPGKQRMGEAKGSSRQELVVGSLGKYIPKRRGTTFSFMTPGIQDHMRNLHHHLPDFGRNSVFFPPFGNVVPEHDINKSRKRTIEDNTQMTTKKRKTSEKKYHRHAKPPYSYVGLIALAIQSSEMKMLKLSEILSKISCMFPFFKGEYQGWRDSVRHNLSQNQCFSKVLPDPSRPHSKGNYWTVDISKIPPDKLKRQNTAVSRNVAPGFAYARDLNEIFDMETGQLRKQSTGYSGSTDGFVNATNIVTDAAYVAPSVYDGPSPGYSTSTSSNSGSFTPILGGSLSSAGNSTQFSPGITHSEECSFRLESNGNSEPQGGDNDETAHATTSHYNGFTEHAPSFDERRLHKLPEMGVSTANHNDDVVVQTRMEALKSDIRRYSTESPVPTDSSVESDTAKRAERSAVSKRDDARQRKNKSNRQRRLQRALRRDKRISEYIDNGYLSEIPLTCGASDSSRISSKSSHSVECYTTLDEEIAAKLMAKREEALNKVVDDQIGQKAVLHYGGVKSSGISTTEKVERQCRLPAISPLPASYSEKIGNEPPPNRSPFSNNDSTNKPETRETLSVEVLEGNVAADEKSFEPVGPPNITLPLPRGGSELDDAVTKLLQPTNGRCDVLSQFASTSKDCATRNSAVFGEASTSSTCQPEQRNQSLVINFPDQFDFIKEQASILVGRGSDHTVCEPKMPETAFVPGVYFPSSPTPSNLSTPHSFLPSPINCYNNFNAQVSYRSHIVTSPYLSARYHYTASHSSLHNNHYNVSLPAFRKIETPMPLGSALSTEAEHYRSAVGLHPDLPRQSAVGYGVYACDKYGCNREMAQK